jgi:hypothetical protein
MVLRRTRNSAPVSFRSPCIEDLAHGAVDHRGDFWDFLMLAPLSIERAFSIPGAVRRKGCERAIAAQ